MKINGANIQHLGFMHGSGRCKSRRSRQVRRLVCFVDLLDCTHPPFPNEISENHSDAGEVD